MIEDLEIYTYLTICTNEYGVYVFDQKNNKTLYKKTLKIEHSNNFVDLNILDEFLEKNIFKIEKLIGKFIKNISLILHHNKVLNLNFCIKKKNYNRVIDKKYLENILIEAKDLFKETYQENQIMHMVINRYIVNGSYYSKLENKLVSDFLSLEIQFISLPDSLASNISNVLERYQIKIEKYLEYNYIKNLNFEKNIELSCMAFKIQNGFNENEVTLVPKNNKKTGFFEKFFQLFS